MKFEQLSLSTKIKLVAGLGLSWGGLILMLSNPMHIVTFVMGSILHLDGRVSKMEEEKANESKSNSVN